MILDNWLPDLQVSDLAELVQLWHPEIDLLFMDGPIDESASDSATPQRNELLHAMRDVRRRADEALEPPSGTAQPASQGSRSPQGFRVLEDGSVTDGSRRVAHVGGSPVEIAAAQPLPELIGSSRPMREIAWMARMVAPRSTTVLLEGETGTGKEVLARALHKLSPRSA